MPRKEPSNPRIRLDTSELKSSYCNVCNATATPEEVVLNFGLNQSWDRGDGDYNIALHHRIILSPFAARRLQKILTELLDRNDAAAAGDEVEAEIKAGAGPADGSE